MPSYKLIYFDGKGRAETSRLLFVLAGQEFEDFRFSREDWPKYKPTTPFGQAPVLEIDGKPFAQSNAIEAYLAREFGFHGKTNIEALEIDQVVQLVGDLYKELVKAYFGEESKKEEMMKNFLEVEAPKFAKFFEKLLKENGTGYFVGKTITLADLSVYCALYGLSQRHQGIFDSFPEINAFINRVETHDKLKTYIASRKPTEF